MSVKKAYWGLGIGSNLLAYLIDWARETGVIRKINLKVREDNVRARALYEKFGFKTEGIITRYFYIEGKFYNVIEMGLEVN
ncbi:MAG: GNAT family N-acetyltransferase, partial [Defluviitoga tunisiensis]